MNHMSCLFEIDFGQKLEELSVQAT